MTKFRKIIALIIITFGLLYIFHNCQAKNIKKQSNYTKVIFFHGKYRCSIEQTIELLTKRTVESDFAKALKNGSLKLEIIDYDKKDNQHYINDFKLINQAVVLVKYINGKQIKWKTCKKVWDYVDNEIEFSDYLIKEIKKFNPY